MLGGPQPRQHPRVVLGEGVAACIPVLDEPGAQEDLAGALAAHRRVPHLAPGDEGQPVQRHLLEHHRLGAAGVPVRVEVGAAHEVAGRLLHPLRADPSGHERIGPAGLHHLGRHDPRRHRRMQGRARGEPERGPAKARVLPFRRARPHATQQPREQGAVDPPGRGRPRPARADPELAAYLADLAVHVGPVPHPGRREGMPAAEPARRPVRLVHGGPEAAPELDDPEEVGARVREPGAGG